MRCVALAHFLDIDTPLPDTKDILNMGAYGVMLMAFVYVTWRGLPAMVSTFKELLTTFKVEIKNEREFGGAQLNLARKEYREALHHLAEKIERNTDAIDRNTEATRGLGATVKSATHAVEDVAKKTNGGSH